MFFTSPLEKARQRAHKERLYDQVAEELSDGKQRAGIWAKALADSEGNLGKANGLYIKYRVQNLEDEYLLNTIKEQEKSERLKQLQISKQREEKIKKDAYYEKLTSIAIVVLVVSLILFIAF